MSHILYVVGKIGIFYIRYGKNQAFRFAIIVDFYLKISFYIGYNILFLLYSL